MSTPPRLYMTGITKQYPGTLANDDVTLTVENGQIHALLGENGAGKSTLVKIIYGSQKADSGTMIWEGYPVKVGSPAEARKMGIGMVFQHFSLFEALTVRENIALSLPKELTRGNFDQRIREVSEKYGLPLDPARYVHSLSAGERQRIEIVRCLLQNPKLLIMDEPTSVLTPQEADILFGTLRALAREGVSILYISHKLDEIRALCHFATIMRMGRVVATCDPVKETRVSLAEMMIGDTLTPPQKENQSAPGDVLLAIKNVSLPTKDAFGTSLKNIDLTVRSGEIVGVAGIAGNGQNELLDIISGEVKQRQAEAIEIMGQKVGHLGPAERRLAGLSYVPEERLGHGAVPDLGLWENTFLSASQTRRLVQGGFRQDAEAKDFAEQVVGSYNVKTPGVYNNASSLSGGNLQKFIVGREMLQVPDVLVVLQPTWGVDAGAAASIHQSFLTAAAKGAAILVISQDLDELFAISDRIAVLSEGNLSQTYPVTGISADQIGLMMGGAHDMKQGETSPVAQAAKPHHEGASA